MKNFLLFFDEIHLVGWAAAGDRLIAKRRALVDEFDDRDPADPRTKYSATKGPPFFEEDEGICDNFLLSTELSDLAAMGLVRGRWSLTSGSTQKPCLVFDWRLTRSSSSVNGATALCGNIHAPSEGLPYSSHPRPKERAQLARNDLLKLLRQRQPSTTTFDVDGACPWPILPRWRGRWDDDCARADRRHCGIAWRHPWTQAGAAPAPNPG